MQIIEEEKLAIKKQGAYIQHLRADQNLSVEAFADRLHIKPNELKEIEEGNIEAPDEVIRQLLYVIKANELDFESNMYRFFGERWEALKEKGYI